MNFIPAVLSLLTNGITNSNKKASFVVTEPSDQNHEVVMRPHSIRAFCNNALRYFDFKLVQTQYEIKMA